MFSFQFLKKHLVKIIIIAFFLFVIPFGCFVHYVAYLNSSPPDYTGTWSDGTLTIEFDNEDLPNAYVIQDGKEIDLYVGLTREGIRIYYIEVEENDDDYDYGDDVVTLLDLYFSGYYEFDGDKLILKHWDTKEITYVLYLVDK